MRMGAMCFAICAMDASSFGGFEPSPRLVCIPPTYRSARATEARDARPMRPCNSPIGWR